MGSLGSYINYIIFGIGLLAVGAVSLIFWAITKKNNKK